MVVGVLDLLACDGIKPRRVASTGGGEYASPCPLCGGEDRFRLWPNKGKTGEWWCRQCGHGGDAVQYLRDVREMSFKEACDFLGMDHRTPNTGGIATAKTQKAKSIIRRKERDKETAETRIRVAHSPPREWTTQAAIFVDECVRELQSDSGADIRAYLIKRGLSDETIHGVKLGQAEVKLGFNSQWRTYDRESWGLDRPTNGDGMAKPIHIPVGLVIAYSWEGKLVRLRIRRQDQESGPPYWIVTGSDARPMVLVDGQPEAVVVVESELDALLLHQNARDLAGVVAMGTTRAKPDQHADRLLMNAKAVLVALDTDPAGARQAVNWWPKHYPNSTRLPVLAGYGKDPGEAYQARLDLRLWVASGLALAGLELINNQQNEDVKDKEVSTQTDDKSSGEECRTVVCAECGHFQPNPSTPMGYGRCGLETRQGEKGRWPRKERVCGNFVKGSSKAD